MIVSSIVDQDGMGGSLESEAPPSAIARLSPFALADAPLENLCPGIRLSSRNMVLQKHPLRQGGSHAKANP